MSSWVADGVGVIQGGLATIDPGTIYLFDGFQEIPYTWDEIPTWDPEYPWPPGEGDPHYFPGAIYDVYGGAGPGGLRPGGGGGGHSIDVSGLVDPPYVIEIRFKFEPHNWGLITGFAYPIYREVFIGYSYWLGPDASTWASPYGWSISFGVSGLKLVGGDMHSASATLALGVYPAMQPDGTGGFVNFDGAFVKLSGAQGMVGGHQDTAIGTHSLPADTWCRAKIGIDESGSVSTKVWVDGGDEPDWQLSVSGFPELVGLTTFAISADDMSEQVETYWHAYFDWAKITGGGGAGTGTPRVKRRYREAAQLVEDLTYKTRFPYMPGTLTVFVNGRYLLPGGDFTEVDNDAGTFSLSATPGGTVSVLYMVKS